MVNPEISIPEPKVEIGNIKYGSGHLPQRLRLLYGMGDRADIEVDNNPDMKVLVIWDGLPSTLVPLDPSWIGDMEEN